MSELDNENSQENTDMDGITSDQGVKNNDGDDIKNPDAKSQCESNFKNEVETKRLTCHALSSGTYEIEFP
ncbi:hypothetical protein BGZ65_003342 [Modicella reniformis]|uniref:Uncharacterized protein n=1 Tax=Modicella reniformis TaxID=1440133 RepID=A0A9P6M995_9FUNG|nr:hypothetical protein BGZ65_003342 [Modicella reniformis]